MRAFEDLCNFPTYLRESVKIGQKSQVKPPIGVLIYCVRGLSIVGELLQTLGEIYSDIPFVLLSEIEPPKYLNKDWLIIWISSQIAPEADLTIFKEFRKIGSTIVAIGSSSQLDNIKNEKVFAKFKFPEGFNEMGSFYHVIGYLLGIFSNLLNINIADLIKNLEKHKELINTKYYQNKLKNINDELKEKHIAILSSDKLRSVNRRFRYQLNKNSGIHASSFTVPDFSHNAIVAYEGKFNESVLVFVINFKGEFHSVHDHFNFILNTLPVPKVEFPVDELDMLTANLILAVDLDLISSS